MTNSAELAACFELQGDEAESLDAIYGSTVVSFPRDAAGRLVPGGRIDVEIGIELEDGEDVFLLAEHSTSAPVAPLRLSHLPGLLLSFTLPASYPTLSPPLLVSATCRNTSYLDSLVLAESLPRLLRSTFNLEEPCLWSFLELVRTGDFLRSNGSITVPLPGAASSSDVGRAMLAWDAEMRGATFDSTSYPCGICLETKKGRASCEFAGCQHVL